MNSLYNYLLAYENNKDLIKAYMSNKSIENFSITIDNAGQVDQVDLNNITKHATTIMGFSVGFFIFMFLISLGIWIWAIVLLLKYREKLPSWALVLGVIGLVPTLPGGPILTLIAVYVCKYKK